MADLSSVVTTATAAGNGPRGGDRALALLKHAFDVVSLLDVEGRVTYVNAAVERLLGIPPAALLGRTNHDLVHPADLADVAERLAARKSGVDPLTPIVYRLRHADGSWRWVESVSVNRLDDPAVGGVVVSTRDAGERKRAEAALRESERRAQAHLAAAERAARELALLDRVRSALARELDLTALFRTVVEAVADAFGYAMVSLYLQVGDELVLQHQVGYYQVIGRMPVTAGVSGRVVRSGQPVLLKDAHSDPDFLEALPGIRSQVCVPLADDGRVAGVLNLECIGDDDLGPEDLRLMEALAEHVGVAIGRARIYQEARLSEERFRTAFASSAMGSALVGLDGRWLAVNRALCEIVGYTEAELQERTFQEITHPDDLAEDARLVGLLLAGAIPAIRFEKRYIHKQGDPVWVFVTGSLVRGDDGEPISFLAQVQDVTERRRLEEHLGASEERFRALVEQTPAVVYLLAPDEAQTPLYFSPHVADIFGISAAEAVARHESWLPLIHPDDRDRVAAEDRRTNASGEPFRVEYRVKHGNGDYVWVRDECVPLWDDDGQIVGWQGVLLDIDERKRAEAELQASEERLRLALEAASMASWDWDATTGRTFRSPGMPGLFGLPAEATNAGRERYLDLVHPDDREALRRADRRRAIEPGPYEVEYRVLRPDGEVRWLRDRGVAFLGADGTPTRIVGITQDVTERKRGEDELRAAKEAAEEANRLKSVFLSTMSHELRTPMNAIIGYAHLLLDGLAGPLLPTQAGDIRRIAEGADRLLGLIDDVLDLTRIEAGRLDLERQPVDLSGVVAEVVEQLAPLAVGKGLAVKTDLEPGLPSVWADRLRVRQIFVNLIGNAVKFTETGAVRITGEATAAGVAVAVSDTGIGIAPEVLPFVFDEFRQADAGTTRRYGGSGLGLAISRRLAELHGGTIEAESAPGRGTSFTLHLPVAPAAG